MHQTEHLPSCDVLALLTIPAASNSFIQGTYLMTSLVDTNNEQMPVNTGMAFSDIPYATSRKDRGAHE
ncbi:DNA inversion protein [Salmonella phage 41]|nr:DNA inversion protein [Salmonella phage 41]